MLLVHNLWDDTWTRFLIWHPERQGDITRLQNHRWNMNQFHGAMVQRLWFAKV